jgi:putative ABC transport system permease protein
MIAGLLLAAADDQRLAWYVLAGVCGVILLAAACSLLLLKGLARAVRGKGFAWRFSVANLERRRLSTLTQIAALGLGIMALLLLTLTRGDLLENWKTTVPADAPNRFLVNIQPDQRQALADFFVGEAMPAPTMLPMVRGRLTAVNGKVVTSADYADDRARRLVDREFNLSWAERPREDNLIVAGRWWRENDPDRAQLSLESGIAATLGIGIGDTLTYDVAGTPFSAKVTSLRKVEWDSFRVNFFVIAPPGLLDALPVSFVSAVHVPASRSDFTNRLVRAFPNLLLIDVAAILERIQKMMDQVAKAVEFVFAFTLAAGLAVLYAAIGATRDERLHDAAILRTLGAGRRQLLAAMLAEFGLVGALAGLLAAGWATALSYWVSVNLLNIPFTLNPWIWLAGVVSGGAGVAFAGWLGTRGTFDHPPLATLRSIA